MIKVWLLLVIINTGNPDTVVVDNIATKDECHRIAATFKENRTIKNWGYTRCIEVNKVKGN